MHHRTHQSQDEIERAAKLQLPTKNKKQRSIYHLFPLEYNMSDTQDEMVSEHTHQRSTENTKKTQTKVEKLKRGTAMEVRDKIYAQHLTNK